jgi:amino acid transporter
MKKQLSLFSLAMLIIAAIDSIRNLPSSALFGSSLIFFFVFAAILFLFPVALVSAQLTATYHDRGGIYHWVKLAFDEKFAMLAIWLQWINTMVWYPTILSFIAGTVAYLFRPELASNSTYLATFSIGIFWIMTLVSLKGIHFSAKLNSVCAIMGTVIPMALLIIFGAFWVLSKKPLMIHFTAENIFPSLSSMDNFVSLTAIMASYLGMELAGVHITYVKNPQKNFPRVLIFSSLFILTTMLLGSLSIAIVIPEKEINLVAGVVQVFTQFFAEFNLKGLTPLIVLSIVLGSVGGMINWLTSPARGLLHAAEFGFLPKRFARKNNQEAPVTIMLIQAVLVTVFCLGFPFIQSVNTVYWFLTGLSTNLYMLMYVLLFLSAIKLNKARAFKDSIFRISRSPFGLSLVSLLGLIGCFLTIFVGFFPANELMIKNKLIYPVSMFLGMLFIPTSCLGFFLFKKNK